MAERIVQQNRNDHHEGHSHILTELNDGFELRVRGHIERAVLGVRSSCGIPKGCASETGRAGDPPVHII